MKWLISKVLWIGLGADISSKWTQEIINKRNKSGGNDSFFSGQQKKKINNRKELRWTLGNEPEEAHLLFLESFCRRVDN